MRPTSGFRDLIDPAALSRLSRLTVRPRHPVLGSVSGRHRSATRGASVEFAEYRKYVSGDDPRHLDWRVLARTDRYYMKEFEADTNLRAYLLLDTSASMAYTSGAVAKLMIAKRMAAMLAWMLARQGDAVGIFCFNEGTVRDIPPRRSGAHLRHVFQALADLAPGGGTGLVDALHRLAETARRRALVIVFSDFFDDAKAVVSGFQHMRFRKHDLAVFHLLDRQELRFAFDRPIRFDDLEGGPSLLTDPALIRDAYLSEIKGHLAALRHGCRELGVDYRETYTDGDLEKDLASFLLAREAAKGGTKKA